jgi:hypothetical protein
MNESIWVRVGSDGEYESFPNLNEALEYLNSLNVGHIIGWGWSGMGFETPNYHDQEYISIYIGDDRAQRLRTLTVLEQYAVEDGLVEAYI